MSAVQIALPEKLIDLFTGRADVRGARGGRGSGKTRSFAKMCAVEGYRFGMSGVTGIILCARQYMNSLADSSLEEIKRAIEDEPFLKSYYEIGERFIRSKDGRIQFAFAGLDRSIESVKSKGRILLCWVDEAEPVTLTALSILIPTLREEGADWNAELWVTWNRKRKNAAVEKRFASSTDPLIRIIELNWRDNPKFPEKLERERQRDLVERPEEYGHIWDGEFVTALSGAYFASALLAARNAHRVGPIAPDPLLTRRLFFDIGGTGARADAVAIWVMQFVGLQIRALDHYEAVGQPLSTHIEWMQSRGYRPQNSQVWLPHDGVQGDKVYDTSYEKYIKDAGYDVTVVPNQGKGAAKQRIEAARRHFPSIWFNVPDACDENTPNVSAGVEALGWYHEKKDEKRDIGLGPEHDWSSHSADAFGLAAVCADQIFAESTRGPVGDPNKGFKRAYG